jgi:hypothetical protein
MRYLRPKPGGKGVKLFDLPTTWPEAFRKPKDTSNEDARGSEVPAGD